MDQIQINDSDFSKRVNNVLNQFPGKRRELHTRLAAQAKAIVDQNIASKLNDSHAHVRSWQEEKVGSGGGYARVSPKKGNRQKGKRSDAYGALTQYLEHGHGHAAGRKFYAASAKQVEAMVIREAEAFVDELVKELGG